MDKLLEVSIARAALMPNQVPLALQQDENKTELLYARNRNISTPGYLLESSALSSAVEISLSFVVAKFLELILRFLTKAMELCESYGLITAVTRQLRYHFACKCPNTLTELAKMAAGTTPGLLILLGRVSEHSNTEEQTATFQKL